MLLFCAWDHRFCVCFFSLSCIFVCYGQIMDNSWCNLSTSLIFSCSATLLPAIKRFLPDHWNENIIVWRAPYFHCELPFTTRIIVPILNLDPTKLLTSYMLDSLTSLCPFRFLSLISPW